MHLYFVNNYEIGFLAVLQGWTSRFFSQGELGPGKAKKQGGAGKESKSAGRGRAYISWLKSCPTADETLICIVWSEGSQIYSTFIFLIVIMIIIIDQCCYIVSLRLSRIRKILECHLYFAPPLPCGFDCFAGEEFPLPRGASILAVLRPQYCQVLFFYFLLPSQFSVRQSVKSHL